MNNTANPLFEPASPGDVSPFSMLTPATDRLGFDVGNLFDSEACTPTIRCRLVDAYDSLVAQLPTVPENAWVDIPVAYNVTADCIWQHGPSFVIDEFDQEDVGGEEPHFVRRMVELWCWGRRQSGFCGIRVVNLRRPHHTWFIGDVLPAGDSEPVPTLVHGTMPDWMQP